MSQQRIGILDSYRFIAVTIVIFFHYYTRWTVPYNPVNYYPYGNALNKPFDHGYLGVNFFFIISGFVIYFTITKCKGVVDFLIKRLIRLFPPLLLASIITFFLIRLLDPTGAVTSFHKNAWSFLPSLTFIDPVVWNALLKRNDIVLIDGAYWSLLVEMKFYLTVAVLYFMFKKEHFVRNWSIFVALLFVVKEVALHSHKPMFAHLSVLLDVLFYYKYIVFFSLGIYFYDFYVNGKFSLWSLLCLGAMARFAVDSDYIILIYAAIFVTLFLLFLFSSKLINVLDIGVFRKVGVTSYFIYLLHQDVGILLIRKICPLLPAYLHLWVPIAVYLFFIILCELIYHVYELPSKKILNHLFFGKKPVSTKI